MKLLQDLLSSLPLSSTIEETFDNWPMLISAADQYRVECDEDRMVHLLDGENVIKVSMPIKVWEELVDKTRIPRDLD